jgi:hypothetical protein
MDDFLFLAESYEAALLLRHRVDFLLTYLSLLGLLNVYYPKKGIWAYIKIGDHLGLTIDFERGEFPDPQDKVHIVTKQVYSLLGRAASNARWLPAR